MIKSDFTQLITCLLEKDYKGTFHYGFRSNEYISSSRNNSVLLTLISNLRIEFNLNALDNYKLKRIRSIYYETKTKTKRAN